MGTVVKAWREHRGLIPAQLAELSGLSRGYLSQLESQKIKEPGYQQLNRLCKALEIPSSDLLNGRLPIDHDSQTEHQMFATPQIPSTLSDTSHGGSIGADIERVIAAASLSVPEKQLVAERLIGVTEEFVEFVVSTRRLQQY